MEKIFHFLTDSKDFVLGFEVGQIFERCVKNESFKKTVHNENIQQIKICLDKYRYSYFFKQIADGWSELEATHPNDIKQQQR